jgi:hypothetical protein
MNIENFNRVLDHIRAHPEAWRQTVWHCGTQHCFAGHAQIMSGKAAIDDYALLDAAEFLGLDHSEAHHLFRPERTMEDFEKVSRRGRVFDHDLGLSNAVGRCTVRRWCAGCYDRVHRLRSRLW